VCQGLHLRTRQSLVAGHHDPSDLEGRRTHDRSTAR
jgi:hypothetical protein